MSDAAATIPATVDVRIVFPILVIDILTLWLRAVHAIETEAIKIVLCVGLRFKHN
jgi:hypothetical protein